MQARSIAIVGAGYVGLTAAAGLASLGHTVSIVDRDSSRIDPVNEGRSPLFEAGLDELISDVVARGRLTATTDLIDGVTGAEFIFLAVGTPMSDGGHADMSDLESAFDAVVQVADDSAVIVIKSTVPVGAYDALLERCDRPVRLVGNPEFQRQGTALDDFMSPERIVLGTDTRVDAEAVAELYEPMLSRGAVLKIMSPQSAALIKYASNAYLATKLSFANEMADLAEASGADIDDVLSTLGLDARIGSRYLSPGPGFGGSCLPKDTMALLVTGEQYGAQGRVVHAATEVNRARTRVMVDKIETASASLEGTRITLLGITYKAETDDLRDSPAVSIVQELHRRGAEITLFDPQGMEAAQQAFPWIALADTLDAALAASPIAVIATEWKDFGNLHPDDLDLEVLIDLRNLYRPEQFDGSGTRYVSVGRRDSE